MHRQTLYEERLAILEDYFNIGLKDPDCSKLQLAGRLGVTERQLTRILSEVYHSTFSDILLRSRMSIAHAMVMEGRKTPEEIALAVGYRSAESMKRAYRAFWGFPLKATKQDTKTV
jgi:transcriptional regulator GlxA family with amidase domain